MISTHSRSSQPRPAWLVTARSRPTRQGFSLIEVAIALVIFVIGALAIIRIFPGALSVIGNNGDQQVAANLNRSTLARLKSENAVPYANFNIAVNGDGTLQWATANNADHTADFTNPNNANNGNIGYSVIGVPRFNSTLPSPEDINTGANNSALSRYRGIQGERIQAKEMLDGPLIPVNTRYLFTQFPISIAKINGGANNTLLQPTISQDYTIQNARIDKQGNITFRDATFLDGNNIVRLDDQANTKAGERRNVPAGSMIYVSYRYYNTNGQIWSVNDEAAPVPTAIANLTDQLYSFTTHPPTTSRGARSTFNATLPLPNTTGAVAELVDVRIKRYLGVGKFGPPSSPEVNDPTYPNIDQRGDARLGIIRVESLTNQPLAGERNYDVDYIADWSFLLQKSVPLTASTTAVPAGLPFNDPLQSYESRQIALGAPFIEDQENVGIYSFLQDDVVGHAQPFRSQFGVASSSPDVNNRLLTPTEDELRSGKVTLVVTDRVKSARVAYQTRDRWVQQLSVAAAAYKPFVAGDTTFQPADPWRDYYMGDDNYLYFRAGEAGKTISVSYLTTDATGPLVDRQFVIETGLVTAPKDFYDGLAARVKLTNKDGAPLPDNTTGTPNLISIQSVSGVSVTARTAYVNGTKYVQKIDTTTRGAN